MAQYLYLCPGMFLKPPQFVLTLMKSTLINTVVGIFIFDAFLDYFSDSLKLEWRRFLAG